MWCRNAQIVGCVSTASDAWNGNRLPHRRLPTGSENAYANSGFIRGIPDQKNSNPKLAPETSKPKGWLS
jgi:hypothetical protein